MACGNHLVSVEKSVGHPKNSPQLRKPEYSNARSWHWESVNADLEIKSDEHHEMLTKEMMMRQLNT